MTLTVVVVDDQRVFRMTLAEVIRSSNAEVKIVEFDNAPSAFAYLTTHPAALVITDFVMPGEYDGMELLRRLKSTPFTKNIPVMVLTGRDDAPTRNAALELEATDYLTKPLNKIEAKFRIRNVLTIFRVARELEEAYRQVDEVRRAAVEHEAAMLLEEQLKAARAETAARATRDLFVAMVSHEFRTPLQSIVSTVETLSRRTSQLDIPADILETVSKPMNRLQKDAEQLLMQASELADFVRAEVGHSPHKPTMIELPGFLEDVIAHQAEVAEKKDLKIEPAARGVSIVFDLMRLRQIVSNLVGNSVKYTKNGKVKVVLDVVDAQADPVHDIDEFMRSVQPDDEFQADVRSLQLLKLVVEDSGIGIPNDLIKDGRVFDPWIRGNGVSGSHGMGLGLSIVMKLVTSLKGRIKIESEVNRGTTVTVLLPLTERVRPVLSRAPDQSAIRFPHRILLIDDTEGTRIALKEALEDAGARVSEAASGKEALTCISKASFDMVFLDLQMPEMDGYQLANVLRAMGPLKKRYALVAMSAFELNKARAVDSSGTDLFDAFIAKPVALRSLIESVQHLLPK